MPVDSHLEWAELRDLSAGLWDVGGQLMPPTAAQQMTDCYATPSGGVRAWFKTTTFTTSGVSSVTNERVRGLFVHENITNRSGSGTSNDYYLLTYNTSDTKMRLYRMDGTNSETTWTLIKTFAAGLDPGMTPFTAYIDSSAVLYAAFTLRKGGGTDHGAWTVKYSDGTLTKQTANADAYIANYQSRLIVPNDSTIYFTDPGSFANIDTNTAPVDISEGAPNIIAVATFSPGDLLVFKQGAPIYLVEGDLTNYTVRQMNGARPMGAQAGVPVCRGPNGVLFRCANDGIYETPDGSAVNPLSKNLANTHFQSSSVIAFLNHWLIDSQAALVYDYDTHCWFMTSALADGGYVRALKQGGKFWIADNATSFTLSTIDLTENSSGRVSSYTWKSAPLRHPTGRQIEVRAVEVYARSLNAATSSISVTVNGVTRTLDCDSSGRGALTFYFLARREEVDITIEADSNDTSVEAPMIEAIRIGSQGGHFLTSAADVG